MRSGRILILVAVVLSIPAEAGYADMMLFACPQNERAIMPRDDVRMDWQPASLTDTFDVNRMTDRLQPPLPLLLKPDADLAEVPEAHRPRIVADRQSGVGLCLCGLIGVGMCHSIPWARKRVGTIPGWYRNGCFFANRPCLAISVKLLWPEPVAQFVQPAHGVEDTLTQPRRETVVPFWREQQPAPAAQPTRGPPWLCP